LANEANISFKSNNVIDKIDVVLTIHYLP